MKRVFASFCSGRPGPLTIVVAALHGNEHVGVHALKQLLPTLDQSNFCGKIVGVIGNLAAFEQKQRFIDKDMNRFFVDGYLNEEHDNVSEWCEARGLLDAIDTEIANYPEATALNLLDMHSMSGDGVPFCCFPHTDANEKLAHLLPVPAIADIVEYLPGTLTEYLSSRFDTTMVLECGQHDAPETIVTGKAGMLAYLNVTGACLGSEQLDSALAHLNKHCHGLSSVFTRVNFRYHIEHSGYFEMQPGYTNLQPVSEKQLLAYDKEEPVFATVSGRMVLPCYQKQGDDGFFLAIDE